VLYIVSAASVCRRSAGGGNIMMCCILFQLRLYVDGRLVEAGEDNYEILDDWPLHPTDRVHFTKLVVGGCWKGRCIETIG